MVLCMRATGAAQCCSSSDRGYFGFITAYPDLNNRVYWLWEPQGGGLVNVYVFFDSFLGDPISAAAFRLVTGGGFTGVYVGETVIGNVWFGNTQDGIAVSLDACYQAPRLLVTVQYMTDGTSPSCSWLEVVGHPDYGGVAMVDCNGSLYIQIESYKLVVIRSWADREACGLLPVEESTWGRVKALYAE